MSEEAFNKRLCISMGDVITEYSKEIQSLQQKLDVARVALEWFSDYGNFNKISNWQFEYYIVSGEIPPNELAAKTLERIGK